ncbi:MAG: hypothetical protein ABIZ49_04085 [Opitutaceae bacterium]
MRASLPTSHFACTIFAAAGLLMAGCMSMPDVDKPAAPGKPAMGTTSEPAAQTSALSYGMVTSQVQKGKTTQLELIQLFGGPDISQTDAEGAEVWIYERKVSQTSSQAQSKEMAAAMNLNIFFGSGNAGAGGSAGKSASQMSTTTSMRSLTAIVKFNPDKTVKDYSVRSSNY